MSISMGNPYGMSVGAYNMMTGGIESETAKSSLDVKAAKLEASLKGDLSKASDEELMEVCKSFESYLVEQVIKNTKSVLAPSEEDDNPYLSLFGDRLYESYAQQITERGEIGLAQQLYEAMKRDYKI
ncbi:MAG: hypothetical protein ILP10_01755 [Lachnospiraceae bacterium]|nr:hypothetical protein [Lachnospiraceae bacterium]